MTTNKEVTAEDLMAQIKKLTEANEAMKAAKSKISFKVAEKTGAISVYGLQKFPVSLHEATWAKLIGTSDADPGELHNLRKFIAEQKAAGKLPNAEQVAAAREAARLKRIEERKAKSA